tara:strand:- start:1209 stop:2678 length:1470 start_codon:yes stop_codon:yes gene_type:complete
MNKLPSPIHSLKDHYDVVVVGGGIVGAGIFRDLSLHGLHCLLIDKKDFTSQTSQSSSKMLHGGIRYLEKLDFSLVWEALHEKNLWLELAPHLCYESSFHFPIYKGFNKPLWMVKIGLSLYDFLSSYKNTPHKILSKKEVLNSIPSLNNENLTGAGLYYDAIVDDAKLTLEVIYDSLKEASGSQAFSHIELEKLEVQGIKNNLQLKDSLNSEVTKTISADDVIFSVGPFTDNLLSKFKDLKWDPVLSPSKGSHIWLRADALDIKGPLLLRTKDNRVFFVIPWPNAILVGTTETKVEGNFFNLSPTPDEVHYLIDNIKKYFPKIMLSEKDIISSFSGVRPLIKDSNSSELGEVKREHKVYQPKHNIHVIAGGKYTTFRTMGQEISRKIVLKKELSYNSNMTKQKLRQKSCILPFKEDEITADTIFNIIEKENVRTFDDLLKRRIGCPSPRHWNKKTSLVDLFKPIYPELKNVLYFSDEDKKLLEVESDVNH